MILKTQKTTNDKKQGGKGVEIDGVKHKGGTYRPDILDRVKEVLKK